MNQFALILGIMVTATAILAAPSSPVGIDRGKVRLERISNNQFPSNVESNHNVILLRQQLADLFSRDSFAELIEMELGQTAMEFLSDIDSVFKEVEQKIGESVVQLDTALARADRSMKDRIIEIQRNELEEMSRITGRFVSDLGKVLIGAPTDVIPVADLVRAILCKTLREFVESIHRAMEDVSSALQDTIDSVLDLAIETRDHDLANMLKIVGENKLPAGRVIITHMLIKLRGLLSIKIPMSTSHSDSDSVAGLSTFKFSSKAEAYDAIVALSKLIPLIESTRQDLIDSVDLMENSKVQRDVMAVYDTATNNFVRDVKPIYKSIVNFQLAGCQASDIPAWEVSLSGSDNNNLGSHLQDGIIQVESNVKAAVATILDAASLNGGSEVAKEISGVLDKQIKSFEILLMPLIQTL